jgi:hypothetical protein
MVESSLTKERIDAGAKLLARMDERGVAPDVALWLYFPEERTWKLLLVEVKLSKTGPRAAYAQMQAVLRKYASELSGLSLNDVVLEKPDARVVELIRKAVKTGRGISGIRFQNNGINGTVIEDAYIYRVA